MKRKIMAIGIISCFLMTALFGASAVGIKITEEKQDNTELNMGDQNDNVYYFGELFMNDTNRQAKVEFYQDSFRLRAKDGDEITLIFNWTIEADVDDEPDLVGGVWGFRIDIDLPDGGYTGRCKIVHDTPEISDAQSGEMAVSFTFEDFYSNCVYDLTLWCTYQLDDEPTHVYYDSEFADLVFNKKSRHRDFSMPLLDDFFARFPLLQKLLKL